MSDIRILKWIILVIIYFQFSSLTCIQASGPQNDDSLIVIIFLKRTFMNDTISISVQGKTWCRDVIVNTNENWDVTGFSMKLSFSDSIIKYEIFNSSGQGATNVSGRQDLSIIPGRDPLPILLKINSFSIPLNISLQSSFVGIDRIPYDLFWREKRNPPEFKINYYQKKPILR